MEAVGLQTHIWNNNLRSALLLAGFPVLLIVLTWFLTLGLIGSGYLPSTGSVSGDMAYATQLMAISAPLAIVVALVWFGIAYISNQKIIDLATGLHEGQYSITVARGLKEALSREEMEAVLAHELTHVINRDVRTMVIAAVFAGIFSLVAQVLYRVIAYGGSGRSRGKKGGAGGLFVVLALVAAFIGYLLSMVIRMTLSRSREFVADAGAVELTKNPDAMISALQKLAEDHTVLKAPEGVRSMFMDGEEEGVYSLFATHPPISRRIEALVKYGGGRPPEPAGPWETLPTGPWG